MDSLSFIISGASVVPRSMLIKEMKFKSLFISSGIAMVLGNLVIGLGMALNGFEIWSYVFALISQNAILGMLLDSPRTNRHKNGRLGFKGNGRHGGSTIFNMLNYAAGKVDTMIVAAHSTDWKLTGF